MRGGYRELPESIIQERRRVRRDRAALQVAQLVLGGSWISG